MPHECTTCGTTFPDGSKEMLSGCPDCGGNKFQFLPGERPGDRSSSDEEPLDRERVADDRRQPTPMATESAPDQTDPSSDDIIIAEETEPDPDREDRAQASARSAVVSDDELPAAETPPEPREEDSETADADTTSERPDLSELREELNDQFESIKILQPGEYELNLMELYDREERIVALEEDGRYVIDVPSSWHESDE